MLILRKDLKLGLGIGATVVVAGAAYALVAALSGSPSQSAAGDGKGPDTVATASNPADEMPAAELGRGIDPTLPDAISAKPTEVTLNNETTDPFRESVRTDGRDTTADWQTALSKGEVTTTRPPIEPVKSGNQELARNSNGGIDVFPPPETPKLELPASVAGGTKYTIVAGDTFSSISQKVYGSRVLFNHLAKANPTVDPGRMKIGTVITVPTLDSIKAATPNFASPIATVAKPVDARTEYRVAAGDSLHRIAVKLYGQSANWQAIYDLNKTAIGNDPAKLKLDMILKLPEPPVTTAAR